MSSIGRGESKAEKDRQKQIQDRCQTLLTQMLRDEDNKYCVDCDAKGPRWASWNIGVFLCIRCAGIHRNLGVHISKVKSVNLDSWTPEQVVNLQQMGNSRARAVYEASLPDSWRRPQTDSSLEAFIRAKYQQKRYIAKEWVPPPIPKVDWDKELDEEAERQKKKKKEKQTSSLPPIRKIIPDTNVPALPKPTSSPKSSRTSSAANTTKNSSAVDFLGLNASNTPPATANNSNGNDDVFTNFLSGPPAPVTTAAPAAVMTENVENKGRSAEEESFFNQATVTSEQKKPLSKDSIMALYSSQGAAPQQQSNMFAAPGMFHANPVQFPISAGSYANGVSAVSTGMPLQQPGLQAGSNPFFGMSTGMVPQHGFPMQHASNGAKRPDDLLVDFAAPSGTAGLQQQMAGLNLAPQGQPSMAPNFAAMHGSFPLGNNFAAPPTQPPMGQTFTSHLWQ